MALMMIIGCTLLVLLGSPVLASEPWFPAALADPPRLELPKLTSLELPPLALPREQLQIPTVFFGCWVGNPAKFDTVLPALNTDSPYRLRRITKCYFPGRIETREFTLELTPRHRMLDTVLNFLSLGSHGATVEGEKTDIYALAPKQIYSRGTLTLELTASSLFKFPQSRPQTVVDEELATLVDPDNLSITGRVFLTGAGARSVGTWHADFHH
jgi:hypothetical protein